MSHITDMAERAILKYQEQFDSGYRNENQDLMNKAHEEYSFIAASLLPGLVQEIKSLERKKS